MAILLVPELHAAIDIFRVCPGLIHVRVVGTIVLIGIIEFVLIGTRPRQSVLHYVSMFNPTLTPVKTS